MAVTAAAPAGTAIPASRSQSAGPASIRNLVVMS